MNIRFDLPPHEYWSIAVRKKWLIFLSAMLGLALAWGLSSILPKSYRSNTLILVENQKIPEHYVASTVAGSVSDRLTTIHQYIMSRTVLMKIMEEFKLAPDHASEEEKEGILKALRKTIKVETKGGGRVDAFTISYSHQQPETARDVTARLAALYVEENLKVREQFVEDTSEFLEAELFRAKTSLEEQEKAIALYHKRYMGELPGQTDANLITLNRLQKDLQSITDTLENRADKKAAIQKTLNAYEAMGLASVETPSDLIMRGTAESIAKGQVLRKMASRQYGRANDPKMARVKELEARLAALRVEYKDTYPDVVHLKGELAQAKAALGDREENIEEDEGERVEVEPIQRKTEKPRAVNPVDSYLHQLRKELNDAEIGIARLVEQQSRLTTQIKQYEMRVERAPERQQELTVLQRDYENTKKNYQSLLDKQLNARISANLEKRQKGEAFRILDPANLPTSPESPEVNKFLFGGLAMGCGLGYSLAFLLEQAVLTFRRPEELETLLGLPVLATIPNFNLAYAGDSPKFLSKQLLQGPRSAKEIERYPLLGGNGSSGGYTRSPAVGSRRPFYDKKPGKIGEKNVLPEELRRHLNLVSKWKPTSIVAEQFRVAATRLVLSFSEQAGSVIVVTSAVVGEGKSSTVSNLGYVLAKDIGRRTLLIDCDFKRPVLHTYNDIPSKPGLADALAKRRPVEECLHQCGEIPLWVLPLGSEEEDVLELKNMQDLKGVLNELRSQFEFIILDAPPIMPLADMNLLAAMADMLVLVVRAGLTPQDMVQKAIKTLRPRGKAGVILTACDGANEIKSSYTYFAEPGKSYL